MLLNDGECPVCLVLKGEFLSLKLNRSDFWECPSCHLQACSTSPIILNLIDGQGKGEFRSSGALAENRIRGSGVSICKENNPTQMGEIVLDRGMLLAWWEDLK